MVWFNARKELPDNSPGKSSGDKVQDAAWEEISSLFRTLGRLLRSHGLLQKSESQGLEVSPLELRPSLTKRAHPVAAFFVFCADAECAAMPAKSKALAKAKKALRKFTGELSSPILIPSAKAEWGPLSPKSLDREIAQQRVAKLDLLFAHYRIRSNDEDGISSN